MLFHSYKITRILPWLAAPEKIRVTAEVSGEIHEAFFDLNGILRRCIYRLRVN
jgi:ArsR family metal-binding transcriptional regulator